MKTRYVAKQESLCSVRGSPSFSVSSFFDHKLRDYHHLLVWRVTTSHAGAQAQSVRASRPLSVVQSMWCVQEQIFGADTRQWEGTQQVLVSSTQPGVSLPWDTDEAIVPHTVAHQKSQSIPLKAMVTYVEFRVLKKVVENMHSDARIRFVSVLSICFFLVKTFTDFRNAFQQQRFPSTSHFLKKESWLVQLWVPRPL